MHASSVVFALGIALAGCQSGCDGERSAHPTPPHELAVHDAAAGAIAIGGDANLELARAPGFLDAPAGSLDALDSGLATAERGDAAGRVLLLFFGDSHTAGDSLTSRLRTTWQSRFGDAGRGLVAAGRPPTRHYYQRDVKYGTQGDWKASVGGHRGDTEPFGIGGIRVSGRGKGAQLWVEA